MGEHSSKTFKNLFKLNCLTKIMNPFIKFYESYYKNKIAPYSRCIGEYRLKYFLNEIYSSSKKLRILDLGCGSGFSFSEKTKLQHDVIGVEIISDLCKKAIKNNVKVIRADLNEGIPFKDKKFDIVISLHIIEHLLYPINFLKEVYRILKKDGIFICALPNHFDFRQRLSILFGKGIVHWTHKSLSKAWNYPHIRFFTLNEILRLLKHVNLKIEMIGLKWVDCYSFPLKIIERLIPKFFKRKLLSNFPNLFSIEFIIRSRKTEQKIPKQKVYLHKSYYKML